MQVHEKRNLQQVHMYSSSERMLYERCLVCRVYHDCQAYCFFSCV